MIYNNVGRDKDQKAYKSSELYLFVISQSLLTDLLTSVSQYVVFYCLGTSFAGLRLFSCLTLLYLLVFWYKS